MNILLMSHCDSDYKPDFIATSRESCSWKEWNECSSGIVVIPFYSLNKIIGHSLSPMYFWEDFILYLFAQPVVSLLWLCNPCSFWRPRSSVTLPLTLPMWAAWSFLCFPWAPCSPLTWTRYYICWFPCSCSQAPNRLQDPWGRLCVTFRFVPPVLGRGSGHRGEGPPMVGEWTQAQVSCLAYPGVSPNKDKLDLRSYCIIKLLLSKYF